MILRNFIFTVLFCTSVDAFAPVGTSSSQVRLKVTDNTNQEARKTASSSVAVWSEKETKKKSGMDTAMRSKLLSESIAPWRTLRLFLYGSLGSGAFIGGLINGAGAIAGSNNPEFNLNTELLNVGIDFGAVIFFAVLAKFDFGKQSELQTKVEEKIEVKKEMKKVTDGMKERETILRTLPLEITIGVDGASRAATVGELQAGAKQHMIIVAGPRKACRDALVGANLLKMDFAMNNVLVVPYDTGADAESQSRPTGGFGDKPIYEQQPYIANASGDDWMDYIKSEIDDAVKQSGDQARKEGIAIVVANNGKIIRRGVGTVPWRQMVDQLEKEVNPTLEGPLSWI